MSRLGIELLSVFGMPPTEHVRLAAELGCGHISTGLTRLPFNPHGYPDWSLRDDAQLRRDMKSAMRECGVVIGLGEGFAVRPGQDMRDKQRDFDLMAQLAVLDPDLISYAQLCDVPRQSTQEYMQEAMFDRKVPGTGELPLAEFVAALPRGTPIGLEIPMLAAAKAGVSARDRLRPALAAANALLHASK